MDHWELSRISGSPLSGALGLRFLLFHPSTHALQAGNVSGGHTSPGPSVPSSSGGRLDRDRRGGDEVPGPHQAPFSCKPWKQVLHTALSSLTREEELSLAWGPISIFFTVLQKEAPWLVLYFPAVLLDVFRHVTGTQEQTCDIHLFLSLAYSR